MTMKPDNYEIRPVAELDGQGNGWSDVSEDAATLWLVDRECGDQLGAYDSRADAEAALAALAAQG